MMEIPFTKMHGLGNNYIYLDLFSFSLEERMLPSLAKAISNVHTGIGSDGLILIHPSTCADVGMRIFNKDGSEGQSCGNGLRCTALYAYEHGISKNRLFTIETKAGIVHAIINKENHHIKDITINMGKPLLLRKDIPMLGNENTHVIHEPFNFLDQHTHLTALFMGNPNAVMFVDCLAQVPLEKWGPMIEHDSRFPNRVNVEFVEIVHDYKILVKVWERGSGATKACGTGACAAVVASILGGYLEREKNITVQLPGGTLDVIWEANDDVWMTGKAAYIATGTYLYEQCG